VRGCRALLLSGLWESALQVEVGVDPCLYN
jgi:hypothetical protein